MKIPYYGAGILFWTKDENDNIFILLGKRSYNPSKGKWSISGGEWEKSDNLNTKTVKPNYLEAAIRETREELSYDIKDKENVKFLWKLNIPCFHFKVYSLELAKQKHFVNFHEFSEVKWFNINAIPQNCEFFIRFQVSKLKHQQIKKSH